jgi:hypothetical protein
MIVSNKVVLIFMLFITGTVSAQSLFTDDFESGTASAQWERYFEAEDLITAVPMATAPVPLATGGNYIGWLQDSDGSYTGAALSIAGMTTDQDYSIEADVYCYVYHPEGSAYTGIAFYADSSIGDFGTYIKIVADFDANQRIRLYNNHFDPNTFQYTFEHIFTAGDIPGGIPTVDGWHKMKVEVKTLNADTTAFWCYFDDQELLGCPIYDTSDDRMSSGQYGVFSFQQSYTGIPGYFDNIVVNPGIIPVELTSFTASVNDSEVLLSWTTATELNNNGFEVERKSGKGFEAVGFVPGFGTTTEPHSYNFTDSDVQAGSYAYRLKQVDLDGTYEYSDEIEVEVIAPSEFTLEQNYPNPFNPITTINYQIPEFSFVTLKVYDILGNEVSILVNEGQFTGSYEVKLDATELPSGVYFYQLKAGSFVETKKMVLMK